MLLSCLNALAKTGMYWKTVERSVHWIALGPPLRGASTVEKTHSNSLLTCNYSEHTYEHGYHGKCLRHGSPQCMCYMNIHDHTWTALGFRPNSTCKASERHLPAAKTSGTYKSTYSLSRRTDHVGITTMMRLDQGHWHPKLEVPRLTCLGRDLNSGLHSGRQAINMSVRDHGECSRHVQYCAWGSSPNKDLNALKRNGCARVATIAH